MVKPPPSTANRLMDVAYRVTTTGLVGLSIWGIWLTGAIYKSRHGDPYDPIGSSSSSTFDGKGNQSTHPGSSSSSSSSEGGSLQDHAATMQQQLNDRQLQRFAVENIGYVGGRERYLEKERAK